MGEIVYTEEQLKVINTRKANLLVSAAAGSGKTAVLSARIMSLIHEGMDIDRMLIVTFTVAAAAEMKERIAGLIDKEIGKHPEDSHLKRQQALIANAKITTIDAFCNFVVKNNFSDIDIEPGFIHMDEGQKKLLLKDSLDKVLEEYYRKEDPEFINLVEAYTADGSENSLEQYIAACIAEAENNLNPEKWLKEAYEGFECDEDTYFGSSWWQSRLCVQNMYIAGALEAAVLGLELCSDEAFSGYRNAMSDYASMLRALKANEDYEARYTILQRKVAKFSPAKRGADEETKAEITAYRNYARKVVDMLAAEYKDSKEALLHDAAFVAAHGRLIIKLAEEVRRSLVELKREKNLVDFSDIEHFALDILTKEVDGVRVTSPRAETYREHYDVVMVDEYQDSNYVQEYILRAVAGDDNYFMVGDVKQSIYSFRKAKPEIFINKYRKFKKEGIDTRINLNKNFRSRKPVTDFVNMIFESIMNVTTCDIDYDEETSLKYGADYYEKAVGSVKECDYQPEVLLLDKSYEEVTEELGIPSDKHCAEAYMIGLKIKELLNGGYEVYDDGVMRPASYGDVVILLRQMAGGLDERFKETLENMGIPVVVPRKSGYFDTYEVKTVINFLEIIDNPRRDIPLYSVLTSFFGGFTEEEIAAVKAGNDKCLYDVFLMNREDTKVAAFLDKLDMYRELTPYTGIQDILEKLIFEEGYMEYMTAFPGGIQRRANLEMLMQRAGDYAGSGFYGVFRFVRYISLLKAREVDYGEAEVIDEHADVVRIMTIHNSKGLEFPICFVSVMGGTFHELDRKCRFIADSENGIALNYIDPVLRVKRDTLKLNTLRANCNRDTKAEEIRVLYVALTRAREKLIITGYVGETEKYLDGIVDKDMLESVDVLGYKKYIDLIVNALGNRDRVAKYVKCIGGSELVGKAVNTLLREADKEDRLVNDAWPVIDEVYDGLMKNLSMEYSYDNLKGLYNKTTVSELKAKAYEDEEVHRIFKENEEKKYIPKFKDASAHENHGALTGSAYHRVMELCDFTATSENLTQREYEAFVADTIERETASGRYSAEYSGLVRPEKCAAFFRTQEACSMMAAARAGKLYKEKPFFHGISAKRLDAAFPEEENVLIQGVIDVYYEEDGELVVLDYKTDRVEREEELVSRYRTQLELYSEALEKITGMKVKGTCIYSFFFGKTIWVCKEGV